MRLHRFVLGLSLLLAALPLYGQAPNNITFYDPPVAAEANRPRLWVNQPRDPGRFWFQGEYLMWQTSGNELPPLVTAAPAGSTSPVPGALGNADTQTLVGDETVNSDWQSGWRVRAGMWLNAERTWGLEASFFYLNQNDDDANQTFASDGTTVSLFRPIFNTVTGQPGVEIVSSLAFNTTGGVNVDNDRSYLGGDLNLRCRLACCGDACRGYRLDLIGGYRIQSLSDDLTITENLTTAPGGVAPPGSFVVQDSFSTSNVFHGLQVGVDGEWYRGNFFAGARATVAVGVTHQEVDIEGSTVAQPQGGAAQVFPGGLLALPSNIGHYERDEFTVVPALGLRVGYKANDWLRASVGYDLIYTSNVVQAGDQIDLVVNPNQVPPPNGGPNFEPNRPAFQFRDTDFFAHGLTLSVELKY